MKNIFRKIKENKSFIAPLLILLVSLIIFGSGITYAYFQYAVEKSEISSLKVTGTDFDILIAGTPINASGVVLIYDEYKDSQSQKYNFTIKNQSEKINACYDVILNVTNISRGLKNSNFKWELTNNKTGEVNSGNFSKSGNNDEITMEKSQNLARNEIISYTLKIWLAYSTTEDQSSTQGASFAAKIKASVTSEYCGELAVSYFEEFEASQSFVAPSDGTYKVELWGAQGGSATGKPGGYGAYTSGEITLSKGDKFYIHVGSVGKTVTSGTTYYAAGGYNGGGYGGNNSGAYSMGGGGATDIRLVGGYWDDTQSLNSRIMVAAGGGGATTNSLIIAGNAGGLTGYKGTASSGSYSTSSYYANGGTQSAGGASAITSAKNGLYGKALQSSLSGWGGGGGGGLYGGAMGNGTGGGGGSSYISGHTGCATHSTGEVFTNTKMIDGSGKIWTTTSPGATTLMPKPDHQGNYASGTGNTGSGHARITLIKKYNVSIVAYDATVSGGTTITNLVTNGGFESNVNNWTSLTSGTLTHELIGGTYDSGFAKIPNSVNLYKMYSNTFNIPSGNVVYARANYLKKDSGNVNIMISDRTSGSLAHLDSKVSSDQSYDWKSISLLAKNTSRSLTAYNFELSSLTNSYTGWDNAMVFNASTSYGSSSIPNISWIDENVPFVNGTGSVKTVKVLNDRSTSFNITPNYTYYNDDNYVCYGEYDNAANVNNIFTINGIESDVVCYLYYGNIPNYTIAYNLNGGNANNITSYNLNTPTFTLNNPTKPGYDFTGWTGSNGDTPQLTVTVPQASSGNKTYTANWLASYTITYNLNSNVQVNNPTIYLPSTPSFTLNNPSKPGYTFVGWTGSNGDTPQLTVTISQGSSGNKAYTANWQGFVVNYDFISPNGGEQTFTAPLNGIYEIKLWGASAPDLTYLGGKGAYTSGRINLSFDEVINIYVGGSGTASSSEGASILGGYNGGGGAYGKASSGGGATDIRYAGNNINSRIMVAAGGGGAVYYSNNNASAGGGGGGGIVGLSGTLYTGTWRSPTTAPTGGTQSAGGRYGIMTERGNSVIYGLSGEFGAGANGGAYSVKSYSAGGGGGYYGGGMGRHLGAAGGSSYISGHAGCLAINSAADTTNPRTIKTGCSESSTTVECSIHYSGKVFTNTTMIDGETSMTSPTGETEVGHTGNGYARITYLGS